MKNKKEAIEVEITPLTLAVLPQYDENGYLGSMILEGEEHYVVNQSPTKVIGQACDFFGSSLNGRQLGTKAVSQMTHKVPIAIDPSSGMYCFPTTSPSNPRCVWLAHSHIESVIRAENQMSEVKFKNGQRILLDVSFGSLMNQLNRTAQFRYILDSRLRNSQLLKEKEDY